MQWHGPYHATVGRGFQPRRPCRQEDGARGAQATFYRRLQKLREAFQPAKNLHDGPRRRRL